MVEKPPRNLFMCGTKQTLADVPHIKRLRKDFSTISVLGRCMVIYVVLTTLPGRMNAVLRGRQERDKLGTR